MCRSSLSTRLLLILVVASFCWRWRRRAAWRIRVVWIFSFLLSLDSARLPDQRVAGLIAGEEILVRLHCGFHPKGTRPRMHHEIESVYRDSDHVFGGR